MKRMISNQKTHKSSLLHNSKVIFLFIGTLAILTLIFGLRGTYLTDSSEKHTNPVYQEETRTPQASSYVATTSPTLEPTPLPSKDITLPHEFLPGFDIAYSNDWKIKIKQFRNSDPEGFTSHYFPSCHTRCMGIRLSKANVSLEILFDIAYDSNGYQCSNSTNFKEIGNGLYRIKDNKGYFYSNNVEINKDADSEMCVQGYGNFLTKGSSVETFEKEGAPILMEYPRIKGNPDESTLIELDQMVSSIKGFN